MVQSAKKPESVDYDRSMYIVHNRNVFIHLFSNKFVNKILKYQRGKCFSFVYELQCQIFTFPCQTVSIAHNISLSMTEIIESTYLMYFQYSYPEY